MPEYKIRVCPECGEQITDHEWSSERGRYYGHYHDPPEGWSGEDPWIDAVEIAAVPRPVCLDDPVAMARATEAVQVSAFMPHDARAHYIVAAALGEKRSSSTKEVQ